MADHEVQQIISALQSSSTNPADFPSLLSRAKLRLLKLNALVPTPSTSPQHIDLARHTLELGALVSIRQKDSDAFTRYYQQLQPFYSLPGGERRGRDQAKVVGLYLLLLLSQGDYAGFHTLIEGLETTQNASSRHLLDDAYIQYPLRLEQALMEGSYDRVWGETKGERVPSDEFGVFSEVSPRRSTSPTCPLTDARPQVLVNTIRSEIASCSERAYPSLPISSAKNLLFLDSEGAVLQFAQSRAWTAKDGRIYFPQHDDTASGDRSGVLSSSGLVIENTLEYARKLETIV